METPFGEEIRTGTTDAVLASIFRNILMDLGITPSVFEKLLERYIIRSGVPINLKESSSRRGNLKKELLKSTQSWKVFIKGLVFLNVKKLDITIRLHHASNIVTEHSKTVVLTNFIEGDEDE